MAEAAPRASNPIRVNLLPHREMRRARAQRMFAMLAVLVLLAGGAVVGLGNVWLSAQISAQEARNTEIQNANAILDKQIKEIAELKERRSALEARKQVVESLQTNRSETVRLFNLMVSAVPEGVFIKRIKQAGDTFTLVGHAQSSARVSTFMRELAASGLVSMPNLVEVKSVPTGKTRWNEFTLSWNILRASPEDAENAAAEGAGKGQ